MNWVEDEFSGKCLFSEDMVVLESVDMCRFFAYVGSIYSSSTWPPHPKGPFANQRDEYLRSAGPEVNGLKLTNLPTWKYLRTDQGKQPLRCWFPIKFLSLKSSNPVAFKKKWDGFLGFPGTARNQLLFDIG